MSFSFSRIRNSHAHLFFSSSETSLTLFCFFGTQTGWFCVITSESQLTALNEE